MLRSSCLACGESIQHVHPTDEPGRREACSHRETSEAKGTGETALASFPSNCPGDPQELRDCLSFQGSIGNEAWMIIAIAQEQPGFADRTIGQRGGADMSEAPAAPKPVLANRFESQWIKGI